MLQETADLFTFPKAIHRWKTSFFVEWLQFSVRNRTYSNWVKPRFLTQSEGLRPLDTGSILTVHKTFNLRPVPREQTTSSTAKF